MADFPTAAVARLGDYNGERYDAQTNPYGMAIGGHRVNFPPSLNYTAVVVNYVGEAATEIEAFAQQTAADRIQTGQDRQAAAESAAAAATFDPALYLLRGGPVSAASLGVTGQAAIDGNTSIGGILAMAGTNAARGSANVVQRGSAPSGPANGDLWALATGLWTFFGGIARQVYDSANLPAPTNTEIDAGTNTLRKAWSVLDVWRAAVAATASALALRVRVDAVQVFTAAQQLQARRNIDAASRRQIIADFVGDGSTLFYLTPEMIAENPVIEFATGGVLVAARIGTASGYSSGATNYYYSVHVQNTTADQTVFRENRSTLGLCGESGSGTLTIGPNGINCRVTAAAIRADGVMFSYICTSNVTGDRMVILGADGNPLPAGTRVIFYGSKRT